ncbi:lactate racemase domain-containing protein [uncultured Dialister sp.]|uniref:lactate racemase domain-containing protein n=1 Tax=uncultured Dialister sp. TaxID=278064 RepID=UPI0026DB560A|nr:lactate racemase domain-containing protein [uncultured Dialister sp.]
MDLKIRYFKEDIPFHVDDSHHPIVLNPRKCPALESEAGEVVRALEHPIDSPRLKDIVKPGEKNRYCYKRYFPPHAFLGSASLCTG